MKPEESPMSGPLLDGASIDKRTYTGGSLAVLASLCCDQCLQPPNTVIVTGEPGDRRASSRCEVCRATTSLLLTDAQSVWLWNHERGSTFVHFAEESL